MIKYLFLFILGSFLFNAAFAQKKDTASYFIKANGFLVPTLGKNDFILYFLPPDTTVDKDLFVVKEYYSDGKIRYIGNSRTNKLSVIDAKHPAFYKPLLQGPRISFFPNGHKMKMETFENGDQVGDETEYYPNGKLYCTKTHTADKKLRCNECRDSTGKVLVENGNGRWLTFIDERFKNYVEGQVNNGFEEGEWYGKRDDTVNIVYKYKDGELKSCADVDKSGQKTYTMVEVIPEFPGGLDAFGKFLMHHVRYPAAARQRNIQGRVVISFIVESDGKLIDIKVAKGAEASLDEAAARAIKECPPWKPGMQDGVPVRVAYSVPISFTLGGEMTSKDLLNLINKNN